MFFVSTLSSRFNWLALQCASQVAVTARTSYLDAPLLLPWSSQNPALTRSSVLSGHFPFFREKSRIHCSLSDGSVANKRCCLCLQNCCLFSGWFHSPPIYPARSFLKPGSRVSWTLETLRGTDAMHAGIRSQVLAAPCRLCVFVFARWPGPYPSVRAGGF